MFYFPIAVEIIHTFAKGISTKLTANSIVQDLNYSDWFHFRSQYTFRLASL